MYKNVALLNVQIQMQIEYRGQGFFLYLQKKNKLKSINEKIN